MPLVTISEGKMTCLLTFVFIFSFLELLEFLFDLFNISTIIKIKVSNNDVKDKYVSEDETIETEEADMTVVSLEDEFKFIYLNTKITEKEISEWHV